MKLTDSDVAVDIRRPGFWNSGAELSVAEARHARSDPSYQERQDHRGSGYLFGYRPRQDVDPDPEGGPHPEGCQVEGGEAFVELSSFFFLQSFDPEQATS